MHTPDVTSLAVSDRLQNAIKYGTKVRKMGAAGIKAHNSVTGWRKITSTDTEFDRMSAQIVKLSDAASYLAPQIGRLFV